MVPNANRNPKKRRISLIPVPSVYPSVAAKNAAVGALEHVPFLRNRNMLSILSFAHVLVGEPASTSPEHALGARLGHENLPGRTVRLLGSGPRISRRHHRVRDRTPRPRAARSLADAPGRAGAR